MGDPRTIHVMWQPPVVPSGPDLEYTVKYSITGLGSESENVTQNLSITLLDLQPFTNYSVSVQACTTVACGLFSDEVIVETEPEGLQGVKHCLTVLLTVGG